MPSFVSAVTRTQTSQGPQLPVPPLGVAPGAAGTGDQPDLQALEAWIEKNLFSFVAVGLALARIRDLRLYRCEFPTSEV